MVQVYETWYDKLQLRFLLKTAREQYYDRRLDSLNDGVKRNWKVLNSLTGKNKKSMKEFQQPILLRFSLDDCVKRNWKVLNTLTGRNKKSMKGFNKRYF